VSRPPASEEEMVRRLSRDLTIAMVVGAFTLGFGVSFLLFHFVVLP
jgi:hypothetical protein